MHIGLLINPLAGLGGSRGLKGSDGSALRELALALTPEELRRSQERAERALKLIAGLPNLIVSTYGGAMGAQVCEQLGLSARTLGEPEDYPSAPQDTRRAATLLRDAGVDVLVFAGGDGTARDVYDAVGASLPVLGIPAGVKMHSGVFAVSPEAAGELLRELGQGGLVGLRTQEVRDIDEEAFREDVVRSRFYGEMQVPGEGRFLQHTKIGGRESQELVAAEIAEWVVEQLDPDTLYFIGPGSTTAAIMDTLGLENTLLGVDALRAGQLLGSDLDESAILALLEREQASASIFVTAIGGQGHIIGRGNQQLSPAVLRRVGLENLKIVAAKSKITALQGRPLLVDSNDPLLDKQISGYREVITGYDDRILYLVATSVEGINA
ncbi:ATP-NAD kinase [Halioglobus sp. HI00S01]|uniref:ATP-NAD kinase family protein n=1 Tax=Halioglobus sp. HI00S01 TaxID=1822214 RepID=UPI0007C2DB07|nr:ATP-NAD kinase family protein [Halioglobus sp. HI00S01]KZX53352.1 ATP-NAD kinase [Halioglobus sp. HI00S01]